MSKFQKRISKSLNVEGNCLVVGNGFGFLSDILDLFQSVFVVWNENDRIKAKNIIYRDDIKDLHLLPDTTVVFLDLRYKNNIDDFEPLMTQKKPVFVVEGEEVIGREFTKKFYQLGYRAVDQQGYFHIWKKIQ